MRILITGAEGQLGKSIRDAAEGSANEYIFTDVDDLDITDAEAVSLSFKVNDVDIVVNCAAFTDVERAERQEDIAYTVNCIATENIARSARENDMTYIHISTDYVFDGKGNLPLTEEDRPSPCGAYGRTKYAGEKAISESGCRALIIRTAWLYSEYGRNFVKTMRRLSSERDSLKVVMDQIGSPTYAGDLAKAIVTIIDRKLYAGNEGLYHYSNLGVCSWFDLARMTAEYSGNTACRIDPCRSNEYPSAVERPTYSVLDKTKFLSTFGIEIPYWVDSLRKCINRLETMKDE